MELVEVILKRRDTRHFLPDEIDETIIEKAIHIANMAPSVGQLKPTRYVVVTDIEIKKRVKANFEMVNNLAKKSDKSDKKEIAYNRLKLEGILEAPIGIVICCDFSVLDGFSIGTITQPKEMLIASTTCAIHTLWLYLTQCNLAMGWVSILDFAELSKTLDLPSDWFPMGYFCIGKPATNYDNMPMLSLENWNTHTNPPVIIKK
jgi:nicotinate-nucleotide--dimethylbenzimidazole phosphoribosyltransferase